VVVVFSPAALPNRVPIKSSLSSGVFFLRPHILHATMKRPARIAAPPIPTTTPMMVLRVPVLIPVSFLELLLFVDAAAEFAAAAAEVAALKAEVSVEEETSTTVLPETVLKEVTIATVGVIVEMSIELGVGDGVVEVLLEIGVSEVFDELL